MHSDRHVDGHPDTWTCGQVAEKRGEGQGNEGMEAARSTAERCPDAHDPFNQRGSEVSFCALGKAAVMMCTWSRL